MECGARGGIKERTAGMPAGQLPKLTVELCPDGRWQTSM